MLTRKDFLCRKGISIKLSLAAMHFCHSDIFLNINLDLLFPYNQHVFVARNDIGGYVYPMEAVPKLTCALSTIGKKAMCNIASYRIIF